MALLRDPRSAIILVLCAWVIGTAISLPGDGNWDLRNYHLYGPFALFHHEAALDIAPAQAQTFHIPTLDIPYYLLALHVRSVRLLNAVLAIPHAVAVALAFLVTTRVLRADDWPGLALAAVATVFGATGTATWPVLATTMDDSIPIALVLSALLMVMADAPWTWRRVLAAGLLCGAAAGLKLTSAYAGVGLGVALAVARGGTAADRGWRVGVFGAGCVAGAVMLAGWWWWRVYGETGSPLFPYFNGLFRSPLAAPVSTVDTRFFPRSLGQWLGYPFYWAAQPFRGPAEMPIRDPRLALAMLGTAALALQAIRRRDWMAGLLTVFLVVSYLVWLRQFSILRYLSSVELLTGTALAAAAWPLLRTARARLAAVPVSMALLAGVIAVTHYPDWEHAPRCRRTAVCPPPIAVRMPAMAEGSLVLLLDTAPAAYIRVFAPFSTRFAGVHNNLIGLNPAEPLQRRVQQALDAQEGEIWGLEETGGMAGYADASLAFYGLQRDGCTPVVSNLDASRMVMCKLRRNERRG